MEDERTYSKSEIRERRRIATQWVALQQRQLEALAKWDEAAEELDQVEREMAALAGGVPQDEQPAETAASDPQMTGERGLTILKDQEGMRVAVRNVLDEWMRRGWSEDTEAERARVMGILRHSLRRLAETNEHVERTLDGTTYYYTYSNSDALIPAGNFRGNGHASGLQPLSGLTGLTTPGVAGGDER